MPEVTQLIQTDAKTDAFRVTETVGGWKGSGQGSGAPCSGGGSRMKGSGVQVVQGPSCAHNPGSCTPAMVSGHLCSFL